MTAAEIVAAAREAENGPATPLSKAAIEANGWAAVLRPVSLKAPIAVVLAAMWATYHCTKAAAETLDALPPGDPLEPDLRRYTDLALGRAREFDAIIHPRREKAS